MKTIEGNYLGELSCSMTHLKSASSIITDAPTDNNGKGAAFSPTDLLAGALATCMLTIIGIRADGKNIYIGKPFFNVKKKMSSTPRMVESVEIEIIFETEIKKENRLYLEKEAKKCPVALSLHPNLVQKVAFKYK